MEISPRLGESRKTLGRWRGCAGCDLREKMAEEGRSPISRSENDYNQ